MADHSIGPPPVTTSARVKRTIERGVPPIALAPATFASVCKRYLLRYSTKDTENLPTWQRFRFRLQVKQLEPYSRR